MLNQDVNIKKCATGPVRILSIGPQKDPGLTLGQLCSIEGLFGKENFYINYVDPKGKRAYKSILKGIKDGVDVVVISRTISDYKQMMLIAEINEICSAKGIPVIINDGEAGSWKRLKRFEVSFEQFI